jgi:hypothetical protein
MQDQELIEITEELLELVAGGVGWHIDPNG